MTAPDVRPPARCGLGERAVAECQPARTVLPAPPRGPTPWTRMPRARRPPRPRSRRGRGGSQARTMEPRRRSDRSELRQVPFERREQDVAARPVHRRSRRRWRSSSPWAMKSANASWSMAGDPRSATCLAAATASASDGGNSSQPSRRPGARSCWRTRRRRRGPARGPGARRSARGRSGTPRRSRPRRSTARGARPRRAGRPGDRGTGRRRSGTGERPSRSRPRRRRRDAPPDPGIVDRDLDDLETERPEVRPGLRLGRILDRDPPRAASRSTAATSLRPCANPEQMTIDSASAAVPRTRSRYSARAARSSGTPRPSR